MKNYVYKTASGGAYLDLADLQMPKDVHLHTAMVQFRSDAVNFLEEWLTKEGFIPVLTNHQQNWDCEPFRRQRMRYILEGAKGEYHSCADISIDCPCSVALSTVDPSAFKTFEKFVVDNRDRLLFIEPPHIIEKDPNVYILCSTPHGPAFRELGTYEKYELIRGNYSDQVLSDYDHIMEHQIKAKQPTLGRLSVLVGPPGTGKTNLIKAMVSNAEHVQFVYVTPGAIDYMFQPSFINSVLDFRNVNSSGIVFILEDADNYFVRKDTETTDKIANMLNLTDGIMAEQCNLKILASTNAKIEQFDAALKRSGRMCKMIEVLPHEKDKAIAIMQRLTKKKKRDATELVEKITGDLTLAEIYKIANMAKSS